MRLILAGAEAHQKRLVSMGAKNLLFSYYYLQEKGNKFLKNRYDIVREGPDKQFVMIDSGGFTFNVEPDKHTLEELYAYRDGYIAWLRANKDYIDTAVELDVSVMIGDKKLKQWREKYFKPLEDEGIKIIYVWHESDGLAGWKEMVSKHKYIGLTQIGGWTTAQISRYVRHARANKVKVHGFAFTHPEALKKIEFTTVDSTTWASGMKYGCTYVFDGRKLLTFDKTQKHMRNKYRTHFVKRGINWDLVKLDMSSDTEKRRLAYPEISKINILGWVELGNYLEKKWKLKRRMRKKKKLEEAKTQEKTLLNETDNKPIISLIDRPNTATLKCSHCHISEDCDKFDENRESCAYSLVEASFDTPSQIQDARRLIVKTDFLRLQRNLQFEQQSGGAFDRNVQMLSDSVFEKASKLESEMRRPFDVGISGNDKTSPMQNAGGVLASVFSSLVENAKAINAIDAEFTETPALPPANDEIAYSPLKQEQITPHEAIERDKESARRNRNAES